MFNPCQTRKFSFECWAKSVEQKMRNIQNGKILTVEMEKNWRGEKRGFRKVLLCYGLDFKNTNKIRFLKLALVITFYFFEYDTILKQNQMGPKNLLRLYMSPCRRIKWDKP